MVIKTIEWKNGTVKIIDQRKLPQKLVYIQCRNIQTLWKAIRNLSVRGAPALGVAAGFGVLLGLKSFKGKNRAQFEKHLERICEYLGTARPTAANLFNVLNELEEVVRIHPQATVVQLKTLLKEKALTIYEHDQKVCRQMGDFGAALIKNQMRVLTVCNAGALATVDYGTALGVLYSAKARGRKFKVYSSETRPLLQGARLTTWELLQKKIDTTLICDNMAATLMKQGKIDCVITGADRIAANGDAANKIGTYNLAILAHYHKIPFYIAAPRFTFDLKIKSGQQIPIEERKAEEVTALGGVRTAPLGVKVYNPAFDVTDHQLITAIITEAGVIYPPFEESIRGIFS